MPSLANPPLSKLQQWMRNVLTDPKGQAHALSTPHPYAAVIGETAAVSRVERLHIYGHGYFSRIVDCLAANFESVRNVAGEDEFFALAKAYLVKHPSTFKCIDDIGKEFPDFLKGKRVLRRHPYLSDLARLEWAFHESFYADDVPPLDSEKLTNLSPKQWADATITVDPSVRLLNLRWPVDGLWRADGKWTRARLKKLKPSATTLLVFRRDDKIVRAPRMGKNESRLLGELQAGRSMGEALGRVAGLAPATVRRFFSEWVALGVIRDVRPGRPGSR